MSQNRKFAVFQNFAIGSYDQFNPYQALLQKKQAYTEEMKGYIIKAKEQKTETGHITREVQEQINTRHKKLMIQLKNQLGLLKIKESEDPSKSNLQIKRLYKVTGLLIAKLEEVNQCLIKGNYNGAYDHLNLLEQQMYKLQGDLVGIRMTLDWNSLSTSEKAYETAFSAGRKGVEIATPAVRTLLNRWITPLAEESIAMYKSRAVFKAMVDQAIFRSYLEYKPSPDTPKQNETVAQNFDLTIGREWEGFGEEFDIGSYQEHSGRVSIPAFTSRYPAEADGG